MTLSGIERWCNLDKLTLILFFSDLRQLILTVLCANLFRFVVFVCLRFDGDFTPSHVISRRSVHPTCAP